MSTEEPPTPEQGAEIYSFPTPRERAMRRHPASGNETIGEALGRIGVDPTHEDSDTPTSDVADHEDDDDQDET